MADQFNNRSECQWFNEAKLAILMQYLYQLVAVVFSVTKQKHIRYDGTTDNI